MWKYSEWGGAVEVPKKVRWKKKYTDIQDELNSHNFSNRRDKVENIGLFVQQIWQLFPIANICTYI